MTTEEKKTDIAPMPASESTKQSAETPLARPKEVGGPKGLEPTRYGDWERKGRCVDF